jgi:hypothetical protein
LKRYIALILLLQISLFGDKTEIIKKVKNFIDLKSYQQHYSLIENSFNNSSRYMSGDRVDSVTVIDKLKNSGILKLYVSQPEWIRVSFEGIGNSIFFLKLVSDTLQEIGYFNYRVVEAKKSIDGFVWTIEFLSKYILDPTVLNSSLSRKGVDIVDIEREDRVSWRYSLDIENSYLESVKVGAGDKIKLQKPLHDYWIEVSEQGIIQFISVGNNWYPDISFYDENLYLIRVFKKDDKRRKLRLKVSEMVKYVRVSDIYQLNNIKNGLRVSFEKIKKR